MVVAGWIHTAVGPRPSSILDSWMDSARGHHCTGHALPSPRRSSTSHSVNPQYIHDYLGLERRPHQCRMGAGALFIHHHGHLLGGRRGSVADQFGALGDTLPLAYARSAFRSHRLCSADKPCLSDGHPVPHRDDDGHVLLGHLRRRHSLRIQCPVWEFPR